MPSKSIAQQRFFGVVKGIQKGSGKGRGKAKKAADNMDPKDVDDFAFGFKRRGTWWMVENLYKDSGLFDAQLENAFPLLKTFFNIFSFFGLRGF